MFNQFDIKETQLHENFKWANTSLTGLQRRKMPPIGWVVRATGARADWRSFCQFPDCSLPAPGFLHATICVIGVWSKSEVKIVADRFYTTLISVKETPEPCCSAHPDPPQTTPTHRSPPVIGGSLHAEHLLNALEFSFLTFYLAPGWLSWNSMKNLMKPGSR